MVNISNNCAFTGRPTKAGSGFTIVSPNGNTSFVSRRKFETYQREGKKPQNFKYTLMARIFLKKGSIQSQAKATKVITEKIDRGLPGIFKK